MTSPVGVGRRTLGPAYGHPMGSHAVLVDLDGPITRLFPHPAHLELAARIAAHGVPSPPSPGGLEPPARSPRDHVQELRRLAEEAPEALAAAAAEATRAELAAAAVARPARGAEQFLRRAVASGYAVGIVSNNAEPAVWSALERCGVADCVDQVAARRDGDVSRLKPAPTLLIECMTALDVAPESCLFLGDTVSDVLAGRAADVPVVGVTPDLALTCDLLAEGAVGVVADLAQALDLLLHQEAS